jgi:hypothetical protein
MKTNKMTKCALIAMAIMSISPTILAQDNFISATDDVLNSEQINIEGQWQKPVVEKSSEEIIEEAANKAEINNAKMIANKIKKIKIPSKQMEKIRKKQAKTLSAKIANLFGGEEDSVSTSSSGTLKANLPQQQVASNYTQNKIKIIPAGGMTMIEGEGISLESKISTGIAIEANVHPRFSVGMAFNYNNMDLVDIDDNMYNGYMNNGFINNGYGYGNQVTQGRELSYNQFNVDLNSKFFLTVGTMIRPYVGLGLGFNRSVLKYKNQGQNNQYNAYGMNTLNTYNYNYNNQQLLGEEEYTTNFVSASAMVGSEVMFSKNVGVNVELKYTKGLTGGLGTKAAVPAIQSMDQQKLEKIGSSIEESHFASINAGLVVSF